MALVTSDSHQPLGPRLCNEVLYGPRTCRLSAHVLFSHELPDETNGAFPNFHNFRQHTKYKKGTPKMSDGAADWLVAFTEEYCLA